MLDRGEEGPTAGRRRAAVREITWPPGPVGCRDAGELADTPGRELRPAAMLVKSGVDASLLAGSNEPTLLWGGRGEGGTGGHGRELPSHLCAHQRAEMTDGAELLVGAGWHCPGGDGSHAAGAGAGRLVHVRPPEAEVGSRAWRQGDQLRTWVEDLILQAVPRPEADHLARAVHKFEAGISVQGAGLGRPIRETEVRRGLLHQRSQIPGQG
jgi:hypothetical protein